MKVIAWAIVFAAICLGDSARLVLWRLMTKNPNASDYPISVWIGLMCYGALGMVLYFSFKQ